MSKAPKLFEDIFYPAGLQLSSSFASHSKMILNASRNSIDRYRKARKTEKILIA